MILRVVLFLKMAVATMGGLVETGMQLFAGIAEICSWNFEQITTGT